LLQQAGLGFLIALLMRGLPLNTTVDENFGVKAKKLDSVDSLEKADREQQASVDDNPQQLPLPMAEAVARSA